METDQLTRNNEKQNPKSAKSSQQQSSRPIIQSILIVIATCMLLYTFIAVTYLLATETNQSKNESLKEETPSPTINEDTSSPTFTPNAGNVINVLIEEQSIKFAHLLSNDPNANDYDFEASGIVYDSLRDVYWIVFDNLWSLGKISSNFSSFELIQNNNSDVNRDKFGASSFEGIAWDSNSDFFYLLSEAVTFTNNENEESVHHPMIRKIKFDESANVYIEEQTCAVQFMAKTDNKGFESLSLVQIDANDYFIGLCEGNYCGSGDEGRESGNGRAVLFEFEASELTNNSDYGYLMDAGIDCLYKTIETFELPSFLNFSDYSAMNFHSIGNNQFDAVFVSQSDSLFWFGSVELSLEPGIVFDLDKETELIAFPKNGNSEMIFCNVEGVAIIKNSTQFVMVSDKAKSGASPAREQKSESIHVFDLQVSSQV